MEAKPVQHSEQPGYPTRREVLAGAASFALFSLTGCDFISAESEEGKITVAPIFKHGEGRGATGCVVVSPPVFLSEEEGMQILREELAKHGIQLKAGGTLEAIRMPARTLSYEVVDKGDGQREVKRSPLSKRQTKRKPLKLDGIDSEKKIAVEFVSERDYRRSGRAVRALATVQCLRLQGRRRVRCRSRRRNRARTTSFFGMFYDPLTEMS